MLLVFIVGFVIEEFETILKVFRGRNMREETVIYIMYINIEDTYRTIE